MPDCCCTRKLSPSGSNPLCHVRSLPPFEPGAPGKNTGTARRNFVPVCLALCFVLTGIFRAAPVLVAQQQLIRALAPGEEFIQQTVPARQTSCELEPGDQVWVISTREMTENPCAGNLQCAQYDGCEYRRRTLDELSSEILAAPDIKTVFYVHGNFTDLGWSLQRGCEVYRRLFRGRACRAPVRFIIWSWKSEREAGPIVDFSVKSRRAVEEGANLVSVVNQLQPSHPVVIGYSLGCQVVLSGLTQPDQTPHTMWSVGLIAPALECDFDRQLCLFPLNTSEISELNVFTNARDRALKYAGLRCRIKRCGNSGLNQHTMVPWLALGDVTPVVWDIGCEVGRQHSINDYIASPTILSTLREMIETMDHPPTDPAIVTDPVPALGTASSGLAMAASVMTAAVPADSVAIATWR